MPLFDDATPARNRETSQQTKTPQPIAAESSEALAEKEVIRKFLSSLQRSTEDIGKIERMALGLLPPDLERIATYGHSPLEEANRLTASVSAFSIRASQLAIDDFLAQVSRSAQPTSDSLLHRLARAVESPLDLDAVDRRLSELSGLLVSFRQDLQKLQPGLTDTEARLDRHSLALAALISAYQRDPRVSKAAQARKALLDGAASGAAMSIALHQALDERARQHAEAIDRMRYVSIPNWRVLHAMQAR
jgi:hypothetical protein